MDNSSEGKINIKETKKLSDTESYSFEYNGETFIYPKSVLDIIKLYKGEIKNNDNIGIYRDNITIGLLLTNNQIYLNFDGTKYYFIKQNKNLTLETFLKNCTKGNKHFIFNNGDGDIFITEDIRNEIACILHFLENENNVDNLKTLIELQNVGNIQQNPETKSMVEGNKGKVGEILESKNESFEVAGNKVVYPDIVQKLLDGVTFEEFKNLLNQKKGEYEGVSIKAEENLLILFEYKQFSLKNIKISFLPIENKIIIVNKINLNVLNNYNPKFDILYSFLYFIDNLNGTNTIFDKGTHVTTINLGKNIFKKEGLKDGESLKKEGKIIPKNTEEKIGILVIDSGNLNIKIGINGEIKFKGKLTDKEKIRELNVFIGILLNQAKDSQNIKEVISIISKIDKLNIERKRIKNLDIKTKNLDLVEQAIEKLKKEKGLTELYKESFPQKQIIIQKQEVPKVIKSGEVKKEKGLTELKQKPIITQKQEYQKPIKSGEIKKEKSNKTIKPEPQENNGGVKNFSKEKTEKFNGFYSTNITPKDNFIQKSLENSAIEGKQINEEINKYKEKIIKLKDKFNELKGDKENIEKLEKIINAIKTLNKLKKELERKIKDKDDNYNEKNDPINNIIKDFEKILKGLEESKKNNT